MQVHKAGVLHNSQTLIGIMFITDDEEVQFQHFEAPFPNVSRSYFCIDHSIAQFLRFVIILAG